jgi:hypothetical protein
MRGLPIKVKEHLEKARDSAILAVEIYNKPAVKFKSGCYISLMVIAWSSLFHAIFFKRGIKPFRKKDNDHYDKVDGDYKYWNLMECLHCFFKEDTQNPIRRNLELFIPLRNHIEHRSMPALDANIFGECQSMLLNFDSLIENEFGIKYCLRESLSFSLQLFPAARNLGSAVKKSKSLKSVMGFIESYRSSISPQIINSGQFAFKAFLIQVSNHDSKDALPIQFIHYDKLSDGEKEKLTSITTMVKYKEIPVLNRDTFRASDVVKKVQEGIGNPKKASKDGKQIDKFNMEAHSRCWRKYQIRPRSNAEDKKQTKPEFCIYDKQHDDYGYTQAWVDFLIGKMKDETEYNALFLKHDI